MVTSLKHEPITICVAPQDWERTMGDVGAVLMRALERHTSTPWRLICPNVAVERVEPYRTLVVNAEALRTLREQRQVWEEQHIEPSRLENMRAAEIMTTPLEFTTELYAPLEPEPHRLG